jgi:chemotaxis protein MotB
MSRKKHHEEHENHERWLVSYADFITLLFAFFVVMFASSQTDKAKAKEMAEALKQAFEDGHFTTKVVTILGGTVDDKGKGNAQMKGPGGAEKIAPADPKEKIVELVPSMKILNAALEAEIKAGHLEVHLEPRGLVISLKQAAFFPSGADVVSERTYATLEKIAMVIHKLPNPVRLEGHTDAIPIHNFRFRSNWDLSASRAIAVRDLFDLRFRVPEPQMAIAGYADTNPIDTNATEEGRAHNRRVDILILNERGILTEPARSKDAKPEAKKT